VLTSDLGSAHERAAPFKLEIRDLQMMSKNDAKFRRDQRWMDMFFFPMRDPLVEHHNTKMIEYARWVLLENAPVSTAARKFVLDLQKAGVPPSDWTDRHGKPLLAIATRWNYVNLFKFLVSQGCDVNHNGLGKTLLFNAEVAGYKKLASYIKELVHHMEEG
jgi:hypothetical protein